MLISLQLSCSEQVNNTIITLKNRFQILLLQVTTQSKIRLIADNLVSYKKTLNSFSQKIVSLDIFISEKNLSIFSLIKNTQEFNSQCRQISSQLCEKLKENFSFVLHRDEILKKTNHVYIFHQETIQNQLLEFYHDCFNENY